MKGSPKVLAALDSLLTTELAAINQYFVHSEMLANDGYDRLAKVTKQRALAEMGHAEKLIERILFLEGRPTVDRPLSVNIASKTKGMLANDLTAEKATLDKYNSAIGLCRTEGDNVTREMLERIAKDEDEHANYLESSLAQVRDMGEGLFLSHQT
ncbi:MAG: bacterioferritin [Candidatus Hydrogenedentales bacterium]|jgi:bacterioferritin